MSDITGKVGELHFKVQVTRKETGKVEEYNLVGKISEEEAERLGLKEKQDGGNTQHGGA